MINIIKLYLLIASTIISPFYCNASSKSDEIKINEYGLCHLKIGLSEKSLEDSFRKIIVYNEEGESYKYRGRACNSSVLVEAFTVNNKINKLSIIDDNFCYEGTCIGDSFTKTRNNLVDSTFYFSGEDGGLFALVNSKGISYIFSKDGIDISCYVKPGKCEKIISEANLESIVIIGAR